MKTLATDIGTLPPSWPSQTNATYLGNITDPFSGQAVEEFAWPQDASPMGMHSYLESIATHCPVTFTFPVLNITMNRFKISTTGIITGMGQGFAADSGPGAGLTSGSGGSYGGPGGRSDLVPGTLGGTYGNFKYPTSQGSGCWVKVIMK